MESVLKDIMTKYLESESITSTCQHGFCKMHSTGLLILESFNDWMLALDNRNCVDVCYLDFLHAFDTASLPKLIYKLSAYEFKGKLLEWLTDFFTDRKLCVKVNGEVSKMVLLTSYLPMCLKHSVCKMFANDAKLYYIFRQQSSTDEFQTTCKRWLFEC